MSSRGRIVVGFDGSAGSWSAARYAASEAAAAKSSVCLVHALLDRVAYAAMVLPAVVADARTEACRLLDAAQRELVRRHPGLDVATTLSERAPAAALVRAARSADLVVVGRHGDRSVHPAARLLDAAAGASLVVVGTGQRGRGRQTGMGTVPETLLRIAACPVAVARTVSTGRSGTGRSDTGRSDTGRSDVDRRERVGRTLGPAKT